MSVLWVLTFTIADGRGTLHLLELLPAQQMFGWTIVYFCPGQAVYIRKQPAVKSLLFAKQKGS